MSAITMAMSLKDSQNAAEELPLIYSTKWGCIVPRIRHPSDEKPREMRGYEPLAIISANCSDTVTGQTIKHNYHSAAMVFSRKPEELFIRPSEKFGSAYLDVYIMLPLTKNQTD